MTFKDMLTAIRDKLQSELSGPTGRLANEGLSDFDSYLTHGGDRVNKSELSVYLDNGSNTEDLESIGFIIRAQLYQVINDEELTLYNDVIYNTILETIVGNLIGFQERDTLNFEQFPYSGNSSSAFILYQIQFRDSLDDCEEA